MKNIKKLVATACAIAISYGVVYGQDSTIIGKIPTSLDVRVVKKENSLCIDLQKMTGEVVLLDFWATWCVPCIEAFPHLNRITAKYKDKHLKVISITYEPESKIIPFLKKKELNTIVVVDNDFHTFRAYNAWAIPNIVIIGKSGKIVGRIHPNKLTDAVIEDLLAGIIPSVEQTPENLFKPAEAEKYFRTTLEEKK